MSDTRVLKDQSARDSIVADLDRSLLVEAAAGTGKTTSMVARMTALLREGKVTMPHIAAMTFTVKAAGHLRQKFETALQQALHQSEDDASRTRLAEAVRDIDRPFIGTIHAFCATLLRERPLEAGVDPDFRVMDEGEAASLQRRVFRDAMREAEDASSALADILAELRIPVAALRDAYQQLCAFPDVHFPGAQKAAPDFSSVHAHFVALVESLVPHLPPEGTREKEDTLQKLLRGLLRQPYREMCDAPEVVGLLSPFRTGRKLVLLKCWTESDLDAKQDVRERVDAFANDEVEPALRQWEEYLYPHILEQARAIALRYEGEKQRRGLLSHDDLLLRTRDMLRDHPDVRIELQRRCTHLLVDEFQDTDPVQAEIMLFLTGENTEETNWRNLRPRPGSLFIVGDPRQSIYRFRRADITVYNAVARILEATGAARLHLTSSFRSLPAVCSWVNATFGNIFPAKSTPYQAARAPLTAVRQDGGALCGVFGFPLTYVDQKSPRRMLETECEAIARWTAEALASGAPIRVRDTDGREVERPLQPRDILLLTPVNDGINAFASAMEARGIPASIAGGYALRDRETLRPLMHILHALADPLDEISVVAFLRGPYCGADDAALADYRARGGRFTFFSSVVKEADARILHGLAFLKGKVRLLRSLPPAAVVGSILEETGLLAWTASGDRGNLRAGTLQRLVEFVQHASAGGTALAAIVRQLDTAMEGSRIDGMGLFADDNALRIMNVHKAKGLEAPVVILVRHHPGGRGQQDRLTVCIERRTQPPQGGMRVQQRFDSGGGVTVAVSPGWEAAREEEQRFLDAESRRLQYVAATRAECALIVVRRCNTATSPETWDALLDASPPDCPVFPPLQPETTADPKTASLPSPADAAEHIARQRAAAAEPGYALQSPSRSVTAHGGAGEGEGRAFGSATHRLLELALQHDIEGGAEAARIAEEEGLAEDQYPLLLDVYRRVTADPLWTRMRNARQRFAELPFSERLPDDESDDSTPVIMSGIIDAVFEDEEGWTLIDYKTDLVERADDERVRAYRAQIASYRDAWRRITGTEARALLWFVCTGLQTE